MVGWQVTLMMSQGDSRNINPRKTENWTNWFF